MADTITVPITLVENTVTAPVVDRGTPGPGVPAGGSTGQVLAKTSNADRVTGWISLGSASLANTGDFATAGHTHADIADATDAATPNKIAKRDSEGAISFLYVSANMGLTIGTALSGTVPLTGIVTFFHAASNYVANLSVDALTATRDIRLPNKDGTLSMLQIGTGATDASAGNHSHTPQTTISGNAGTATTLQNPRTINGVSFNGSDNIATVIEVMLAANTVKAAMNSTTLADAGVEVTLPVGIYHVEARCCVGSTTWASTGTRWQLTVKSGSVTTLSTGTAICGGGANNDCINSLCYELGGVDLAPLNTVRNHPSASQVETKKFKIQVTVQAVISMQVAQSIVGAGNITLFRGSFIKAESL